MTRQQVVVVTGATRGLGREMTAEFVRRGWTVAGCGTRKREIESLRGTYPAPHDFQIVDVTEEADVKKWASSVLQLLGPPDLLINNAAIINRNAPLWVVKPSEFDRVVDVNIKGVVNVIRHFVPAMVRRRHGVVVNFSSGWGRTANAEVAPYCATKWAIEGLTKSLALELPSGMAAIPLNPGVINTEMLQSCFGSSAATCIAPKDWARTAVPFLAKLGPRDNGRSLTAP